MAIVKSVLAFVLAFGMTIFGFALSIDRLTDWSSKGRTRALVVWSVGISIFSWLCFYIIGK